MTNRTRDTYGPLDGMCELCGQKPAQSTRKVDGEKLAVCPSCLIANLGD